MTFVLLLILRGGRLADTACSRRCHASIKSRQTSPTGDERQNRRKSGLARPTASKRVSSPPGRDPHLRVGRHRQPESKQQASERTAVVAAGSTSAGTATSSFMTQRLPDRSTRRAG